MKRVFLAALAAPLIASAQTPQDADYWLTKYDGADLLSGQFDCKAPAIPEMSKTNEEIKTVTESYNAWQKCYQGAAANLNDANNPVGKRIPKAALDAMTVEQRTKALDHLEVVYDKATAQLGGQATAVMGSFQSWKAKTESYVMAANEETKKARTDAVKAQLMMENSNRDQRIAPTSSAH